MHYPINRLGEGIGLQTEAHTAIGDRLRHLGYITGSLPTDRESLATIYRAVAESRGEGATTVVPDDADELIDAITAALDGRFCGVPDGQTLFASGSPRGRWERGDLTWHLSTANCVWVDPTSSIKQAIIAGLKPWSDASDFFTFTETNSRADADIRFSFTDSSGDSRFTGPNGVVGSGAFPDTANRGQVLFDQNERWTRRLLAAVTEHEIGHVLGLRHSTVPGSTMFPFTARLGPLDADTVNTLRDLYAWTPASRFPDNRASSDGPALTTTYTMSLQQGTTRVHMVWKGVEGDSGVHISSSDDGGRTWGPQIPLPGIRSSHGPAITGFHRAGSPSPDDLFLAWKGEGADERLFFAHGFTGNGFASIERLEGHSSNARPAVAEFGGRVHMVWKAATGEHVLWSSFAGGQWAPVKVIPNVFTSHAPALAASGNDLVLCWQGMGDDERIFEARLPAGASVWQAGQPVTFRNVFASGGGIAGPPQTVNTSHHPAVASTSAGQFIVGYKGQAGDNAVWLMRGLQQANGPVPIRNALSSTGPGLTTVGDRIICVWKAQAPDQELHFSIQ